MIHEEGLDPEWLLFDCPLPWVWILFGACKLRNEGKLPGMSYEDKELMDEAAKLAAKKEREQKHGR